MRVEQLSDHAGKQLRAADQRLRAAASELSADQASYRTAHRQQIAAGRAKPWWRKLLSLSTAEERRARAQTQAAWQQVEQGWRGVQQLQNRVRQRTAGVAGEDALALGLSRRLSDEWLMLRGYRNRRGEADHVLVGPLGLWVVEVKRRRVRLHAVQDNWRYEKLDSWGNVVETGRAVDGGGRSWARQVNDVAADLSQWLARNGHEVRVRTAVMLLHEQAQIGRSSRPTVDLVGTRVEQLLAEIARHPAPLSPKACADIGALIRRDHRFHHQRRR